MISYCLQGSKGFARMFDIVETEGYSVVAGRIAVDFFDIL